MHVWQAAWVVPIAGPPVRDGWVRVSDGRVAALGGPDTLPPDAAVARLPGAAILPGLVNAHTHMELSWLRGRVPPASCFVDWVTAMMRTRLRAPDACDAEAHRSAMRGALAEARAAGTAVLGDISNSLMGFDLLAAGGLAGVVFHEVLGFAVEDGAAAVSGAQGRIAGVHAPSGWRVALAPHAPYSVSPALFGAVRDAAGGGPTSVHVAESADEVAFVATGGGRWRDVLGQMGAWAPSWRAPGVSPVAYLDQLGFWRPHTLAVHGVHAGEEDLRLLRERGATLVTCPRSNEFVGSGPPPASAFFASGVSVAVGTDSLTSVDDLNLFSELAALRRLAPEVPAARLLHSATRAGAEALGLSPDYGAIAPGARAPLLAVDVPPGTTDVEEYLVGGIVPAQVHWIGEPA